MYSIHGVVGFCGTFNVQQGTFQFTDTDFFTIVSSRGGVVGTARAASFAAASGVGASTR